jgi:4-hydroxy-tetrahydrodipicolinate reductase
MKIALIGYGKMGQEIENYATRRDHEVTLIFDSKEDWESKGELLKEVDVAIEFSMPKFAVENIQRCFEANIPVVTGTTGWLEDLPRIKQECLESNRCLFFAPNFSIGVNLFFGLNKYLARLMSKYQEYEISIEETHHIHKQDSPSGTAITLANDIIAKLDRKEKWVKENSPNPEELEIQSFRKEDVPGTHVVRYESDIDSIQIIHTAKNRKGFALGAIMAAEFVAGKAGFFGMEDLLRDENLMSIE